MCSNIKRKFLFRCEECLLIISVELEDPEDLEDVQENKIELECPCEFKCKVLRN